MNVKRTALLTVVGGLLMLTYVTTTRAATPTQEYIRSYYTLGRDSQDSTLARARPYGDVNGDNMVNALDITSVERAIAGLLP